MFRSLILLAALSKTVFSFRDTYPVLAWSSHSSPVLNKLSNALAPSSKYDHPLDVLYESGEDICSFDAVILVEHERLRRSDLRISSVTPFLAQKYKNSEYSTHFPYVRSTGHSSTQSLADHVSRRCGSRILSLKDGDKRPDLDVSEKLVMRISAISEDDGDLSDHLASVEEAFTRHLFIISGAPTSHLYGRVVDDTEEDIPFSSFTKQNINAPRATGGILKRYQLLTPALIISLLIVFFVIVPILYVGISALASVQGSIRLDAPKIVSQEKKNQ